MIYYKLKYKITSGYYENEIKYNCQVKTDKIWYSMDELIKFFEEMDL